MEKRKSKRIFGDGSEANLKIVEGGIYEFTHDFTR
jgi:hypothetical protein